MTLDEAIARGSGTPSGKFYAPEGPLPPLTNSGPAWPYYEPKPAEKDKE